MQKTNEPTWPVLNPDPSFEPSRLTFYPRNIIGTVIVELNKKVLHAKYQMTY